MNKVFVIAEAGVNHNGSLLIAKQMIEVAAEAGADAVKFQAFITERLLCRSAPKAEYQKQTTGNSEPQFAMLKKLELGKREHQQLIDHCRKNHILYLSSPFDTESLDFLNDAGMETIKIPSGEITNLPLLRNIGRLKKKVILSTGMADLSEIRAALNIITSSGTGMDQITILQCNTEYPTPMQDANISAMQTLSKQFDVQVGYSDHTEGIEVAVAAVALGATVVEKHFTLDRTMEGPDHRASLEPCELKEMIKAIRNIELALGDGIKKPSISETKNKQIARKSIVASKAIKTGDILTETNITTKRPGTGLSPMMWDRVIGSKAVKDYKADEAIVQ